VAIIGPFRGPGTTAGTCGAAGIDHANIKPVVVVGEGRDYHDETNAEAGAALALSGSQLVWCCGYNLPALSAFEMSNCRWLPDVSEAKPNERLTSIRSEAVVGQTGWPNIRGSIFRGQGTAAVAKSRVHHVTDPTILVAMNRPATWTPKSAEEIRSCLHSSIASFTDDRHGLARPPLGAIRRHRLSSRQGVYDRLGAGRMSDKPRVSLPPPE